MKCFFFVILIILVFVIGVILLLLMSFIFGGVFMGDIVDELVSDWFFVFDEFFGYLEI